MLGMLLDGQAILERNAAGERVVGHTMLVLFSTADQEEPVTLPAAQDITAWTKLVDSAAPEAEPLTLTCGESVTMAGRSASIWRADRPSDSGLIRANKQG